MISRAQDRRQRSERGAHDATNRVRGRTGDGDSRSGRPASGFRARVGHLSREQFRRADLFDRSGQRFAGSLFNRELWPAFPRG
ncbi:MAG: hypothetical protein DMF11_00985 [Verrucomicrobia bacterium]|nr:MAG: hypothetical protein DMF11_00985 [Verrucomicrobiota bacterium]